MIRVQLRKAMNEYREKTGMRLTYLELSQKTGLTVETLQAIATRPNYNTTLKAIDKICVALECPLATLLTLEE